MSDHYVRKENVQCISSKISEKVYDTLQHAKKECSENPDCYGVYRKNCRGEGEHYLCGNPMHWKYSEHGSCIHEKPLCVDVPQWMDRRRINCAKYKKWAFCTDDGDFGPGWPKESFGTFEKLAPRSGIVANQACCACGGGNFITLSDHSAAFLSQRLCFFYWLGLFFWVFSG